MGAVVIEGRRVALRVLRDADLAAIGTWYEEALETAGIRPPQPLHLGGHVSRAWERGGQLGGVLAVERVGEPEPIGVVEYDVCDAGLMVEFLGLAKVYRGWGYGSEAVRLLEEWAVSEGVARWFRAEVEARNGLGLYFWLRLGYRPAESSDRDTFVMVRTS